MDNFGVLGHAMTAQEIADYAAGKAPNAVGVMVATGPYTISGNINESGTPVAGVTVTAGGRSALTDASGNYTIIKIDNGSYTVTPTKGGATFSPTSTVVVISGSNGTANFTATLAANLSFSVYDPYSDYGSVNGTFTTDGTMASSDGYGNMVAGGTHKWYTNTATGAHMAWCPSLFSYATYTSGPGWEIFGVYGNYGCGYIGPDAQDPTPGNWQEGQCWMSTAVVTQI